MKARTTKKALKISLGIYLFFISHVMKASNIDAWQASSNILTNPGVLIECIYSCQLIRSYGEPDRNGHREPLYSNNHYRVGYLGNDYYVMSFKTSEDTTNCMKATEAHGKYGNRSWRFSGGILLSSTNDADYGANVDGWREFAQNPLKLGIMPLKLNTLHFDTGTTFRAMDFMSNELTGKLIDARGSTNNSCEIAYFIGGSTNILRTVKIFFSQTNMQFPQEIIAKANGTIMWDFLIHKVIYGEPGQKADFSPENIADCKMLVLANGTDDGGQVKVVDLNGNILKTTNTVVSPNKRTQALVILVGFSILSAFVLFAAIKRKNKTRSDKEN